MPGNGKSLVQINIGEHPYFIASQNNDSLKVFKPLFQFDPIMISWKKGETSCLIYTEISGVQKRSKNDGFSFQSQGTSSFWVPKQTKKIEFYNSNKKIIRTVYKTHQALPNKKNV